MNAIHELERLKARTKKMKPEDAVPFIFSTVEELLKDSESAAALLEAETREQTITSEQLLDAEVRAKEAEHVLMQIGDSVFAAKQARDEARLHMGASISILALDSILLIFSPAHGIVRLISVLAGGFSAWVMYRLYRKHYL